MRSVPHLSGAPLPLPNLPLLTGFQWACTAHPHQKALVDAAKGDVITYAQLATRVDTIAR